MTSHSDSRRIPRAIAAGLLALGTLAAAIAGLAFGRGLQISPQDLGTPPPPHIFISGPRYDAIPQQVAT